MSTLIALLLLAGLVWFWQDTLRARDIARQVAFNTCKQQNLQLLDATVSLRRVRPIRCPRGHACIQRTFVFDYTRDGDYRQQGFVMMDGRQVSMVGLEPEIDN